VVHEELVEVRDAPNPSDAEEPRRRSRPHRRDHGVVVGAGSRLAVSFGEAAPPTGQHEPRRGHQVALADHQVRGELAGRPGRQQGGRVRAELVQQVAQLVALDGIQRTIGHRGRLPG
jgi:hypothetical protein